MPADVFLYEELVCAAEQHGNARAVAQLASAAKRRALELSDQGGLLVSPDGSAVAVLDATATCLTVFHARDEPAASSEAGSKLVPAQHDLGAGAPLVAIRRFQPTSIGGGQLSQLDTITAVCWAVDSSRLAVACASGHLYVLDRSALPLVMLPPAQVPWAGKPITGLALPSPQLLLLLTARPPQLFGVPLAVPPRALAGLRPLQGPGLAKLHASIRAVAFEPRSSTLVIAGDAPGGGGGGAAAAISVSAWKLDPGGGAVSASASLLGSYSGHVGPGGGGGAAATAAASGGSGAAEWRRGRWVLALSPLGEHAALCVPPGGGMLVLGLPACGRVEPGEAFAGRRAGGAAGASALQPDSLTRSAASALSSAWWTAEDRLALSDPWGGVGLAVLPGLGNALAGGEAAQFAPGALVAAKTSGPGPRGLLVLEPVPPPKSPGAGGLGLGADGDAGGRGRGRGGAGGGAHALPPPPGLRLVMMAERTPAQMMQVYLREQQWGHALELCSAFGLDADTVYRARWAGRPVDAANIADNLAKMADRRWVVAECLRRVSADYEGQRKLINYGLRETARQAKPPVADDTDAASASTAAGFPPTPGGAPATPGGAPGGSGYSSPEAAAGWWLQRLALWRHSDRLEALYAAQGRTFDAAAFAAFRDLPLSAAAGSWAALGAVGPLAVLSQHYPAGLSGGTLLGVLSRLPEDLSPRLYSALLPKVDSDAASAGPTGGSSDAGSLRPPARKLDWIESAEILSDLRRALKSLKQNGSGSGPEQYLPDLDPEATDAVIRLLAPRPRLATAAVCEWYAERALQLDGGSGQLQNALALLELAWERGARSARVGQLLGAARALAGVVDAAGLRSSRHGGGPSGVSAAAGPGGASLGPVWRLGLREFAGLPGPDQLRLLLGDSREESLESDLEERVVPFLRGPGTSPAEVSALLAALLAEEALRRPGWAAALAEAEAAHRRLFASAEEMAQAVTRAVLACPHTDEWPALERMVDAAESAVRADGGDLAAAGVVDLDSDLDLIHGPASAASSRGGSPLKGAARKAAAAAAPKAAGEGQDEEGEGSQAKAAGPGAGARVGLARLRGLVAAGAILASRGLPVTVRHLATCGRDEAARIVRQLLGRVQRATPQMPEASWAELWRSLASVRSAAFPFLPPPEVLSELCRCLLHCGRTDLANAYLRGGAPDGSVTLDPAAAEALIASAAAEVLAGASDSWDGATQQALAVLALASPGAGEDEEAEEDGAAEAGEEEAGGRAGALAAGAPAGALLRLISGLQLASDAFGFELIPAQVMQMPDRFEVVRALLEAPTLGNGLGAGLVGAGGAAGASLRAALGLGSGPGATALAAAVTRGVGSLSAALGGRSSRRRAAVRVAGQAAAAGGRAAAALAGGLLAVAGRVAPTMAGQLAVAGGVVAGRVAGTLAAVAEASAGGGGGGGGGGAAEASAGGAGHAPYNQVGRLLELAELLGLSGPEDELRVRDASARSALRCGDLAAAVHLALPLVAARYVPAWSLCADLGSDRRLQDDAVRQRLVSYALLHCPPDRMARLLEELRGAERRLAAGGPHAPQEAAGADPEYHLRLALLSAGQHRPAPGAAPTAALPSPGDTALALAALAPGCRLSAVDAGTLLQGLRSGDLSYAQLQRVLSTEAYAACLTCLLPGAAGAGVAGRGRARLELLRQPLGELLAQVRALSSAGALASVPGASEAAAAAEAAEQRLAAARDSRAVRRHVPGVDAAAFAGGDTGYRRQAILQQAALAGAAEAASPSGQAEPCAQAGGLLATAHRLGAAYGVDPWDIELAFVQALLTSASAVTPEASLRASLQAREPPLLARPRALLQALAASALPALPPASGPHLALALALLTDGLHAVAKEDPTAAALSAAAGPLLDKLRELLEKAAAALKGLQLTAVLAPPLAALLAPLGVRLAVTEAAEAAAAEAAGPAEAAAALAGPPGAAAAAAALFSYVKPANISQAAKLLAALHKLLGPLARKPGPSGPPSLLVPGLAPALDALPQSLPVLCLAVKAVGARQPPPGGPPPPARDMLAAWGYVAEQVPRLPPRQLAGWLGFLVLPPPALGAAAAAAAGCGSCPLPAAVTGAPLVACAAPADVKLTVLDACMPRLLEAAAGEPSSTAAAPATPGGGSGGGSGAAAGPDAADPALVAALAALHRRLRVLAAAKQHAAAAGVGEEQIEQLEASLLADDESPAAVRSRSSAGGGGGAAVRSALATLAAAGCPAAVLLEVATAASGGGGGSSNGGAAAAEPAAAEAAAGLAAAAVVDATESALDRVVVEATGAAGAGGAATVVGLARLQGVLRCLDTPSTSASAAAAAADGEAGSAAVAAAAPSGPPPAVLAALREAVWGCLQRFTDEGGRLAAVEAAAAATAAALLDLQAGLGSRAMWSDWRGSAAAGGAGGGANRLRQRLLLARTKTLLAEATAPPLAAPPGPDALASLAAAEAFFLGRLLPPPAAPPADVATLRLLGRLLTEVWRDGAVWDEPAAPSAGSAEAAEEGVSPLHRCWAAVARELLRGGHLAAAVSLLDPPPSAAGAAPDAGASDGGAAAAAGPAAPLRPLSESDLDSLIAAVADGTLASPAAAGPDGTAAATAAAWCLGLASPYEAQRQRALAEAEESPPPPLPADADADGACSGPGSNKRFSTATVVLLAQLVRAGEAARLAAVAHPLLPALVRAVPAAPPAGGSGGGGGGAAAASVLPCLAASLVERRQAATAAALVARRLRLHPALAAAGGSGAFLERYLKAAAASAASAATATAAAATENGVAEPEAAAGGAVPWPGAVAELYGRQAEWCRAALQQLAGEQAGPGAGAGSQQRPRP
ncbi:hypothetical protein HYH03_009857 [Edaphochlamys debaryana]|uniref:Sec39 domain-containing protein n=1 Tax=Edaphochlamys debaryana TaxID=47281 RepID=A0A836BWP1_9CHLO|nr:hypothetical protein HYH03_009857 [Edaphochlamys debaryana]|eukprot:KAG2491906.1 hypothetical protein HYH03_009857 [Edaphochlamys debaryana]